MRTLTLLLIPILIAGASGCSDSGAATTAPSAPASQPPAPVQPAEFRDPASNYSTPDVNDVDEQIVHFDLRSNSLIWVANGRGFPGYPVNGNFIGTDNRFEVRFGTKNGQRRAYFTETTTATICDIAVVNDELTISGTNVTVPEG